MGAWGVGPFDNDDASDWLNKLESVRDAAFIGDAFRIVIDCGDNYLEAPDCCNALAAAEVLAAFRGRPSDGLPIKAETWVQSHPFPEASALLPEARAALLRIRENSELKELSEEPDDAAKWQAALDDVLLRLRSS